jgi:murein DD-endopeptidase MepM/ murein hydrolase activator NlpD
MRQVMSSSASFRVLALSALALSLAACSGESRRAAGGEGWGENRGGAQAAWQAHQNQVASRDFAPSNETTGSIARAPQPGVTSQSLPPIQAPRAQAPLARLPEPQQSFTPLPAPQAPQAPRMVLQQGPQAANAPAIQPAPRMAAPMPRVEAPAIPATPRIASAGGSTVVVEEGQSLMGIARRHNVRVTDLMRANNINDGNDIRIGQRLVIPSGAVAARAMAPIAAAPQQAQIAVREPVQPAVRAPAPHLTTPAVPERAQSSLPGRHTVAEGESVASIARRHNVAAGDLAVANHIGPSDRIRPGQELVIPTREHLARIRETRRTQAPAPGDTASLAAPEARPQRAEAAAPVQAVAPAVQPRAATPPAQAVAPAPSRPAAPAQAAAPVRQPAAPAAPEAPVATDQQRMTQQASRAAPSPAPERQVQSANEFRWPVRGRIVSGFGPKATGGSNDGINIVVPAGTPVRASENGVVIYAGNELRGFGNLVLIRHEGDWVTAYAHKQDIGVRRGDVVRRGQVIGRAGQTGNVSQPQLHFEIRRGSNPVDPMQHLSGT